MAVKVLIVDGTDTDMDGNGGTGISQRLNVWCFEQLQNFYFRLRSFGIGPFRMEKSITDCYNQPSGGLSRARATATVSPISTSETEM